MPSWARTLLKLTLTTLILGLLVRMAGAREILTAFDDLILAWAIAMAAGALLRRFVMSLQLWLILRQSGLSVSVFRVFLANTLAALYALFLPGNIASAGVKWLDLSAATGKKAAVFNGLVYNRLVMTLLTLLIGGAALAVSDPLALESLTYVLGLLMVAMTVLFVFLYHPRYGEHLQTLLRRLAKFLPSKIASYAISLLDAMRRYQRFSRRDHLRVFTWALVTVAIRTMVLYFAMRALGLDVSPVHVLWISAFLVFTAALPLTIANLGVREGLLVVALTPFGVAPATAVAVGLLLFANQLIAALIGAVYQLALSLGWIRWKALPVSDRGSGGVRSG